jgi:hypothetical protein
MRLPGCVSTPLARLLVWMSDMLGDWAERLSRDQDLPRGVALGAALVVAFLVVLLVTIWRMVR